MKNKAFVFLCPIHSYLAAWNWNGTTTHDIISGLQDVFLNLQVPKCQKPKTCGDNCHQHIPDQKEPGKKLPRSWASSRSQVFNACGHVPLCLKLIISTYIHIYSLVH